MSRVKLGNKAYVKAGCLALQQEGFVLENDVNLKVNNGQVGCSSRLVNCETDVLWLKNPGKVYISFLSCKD